MAEGFKAWADGARLDAADLNDYTSSQAVMRFASAADRDTSLPTGTVREGMLAYLKDTNVLTVNTTGAVSGWVQVFPVATATIADDAVTSAKIATSAVGNSELASGAVTTSKVAAGTYSISITGSAGQLDGYEPDSGYSNSTIALRTSSGGLFSTNIFADTNVTADAFITRSTRDTKRDISPAAVLDDVLQLEPVTYRRLAETAPVELGLVAEDVAAAGIEMLVQRDETGQIVGVAYDRLAVALLAVVRDLAGRVAMLEGR